MVPVYLVVEDLIQEEVARKVIGHAAPKIEISAVLRHGGAAYIDYNMKRFLLASRQRHFIVIRDLDHEECAPILARKLIPASAASQRLLLSIAVREVEAWLIADSDSMGTYLGIGRVPLNPEGIGDPKEYLVNLARKSRKRAIREAMVPVGMARVGPLYNATLVQFIRSYWRVALASRRAPSLDRFLQKVKEFT
jgi:hypothetical protein